MGDPLGALNRLVLGDDAPALAFRGIAKAAQLVRANESRDPSLYVFKGGLR